MSIASRAGIECLSAKVANDRAFLQKLSEITFSNEDIEVGYPNHKRKGIAMVVICADLGKDEEMILALPAAAITTLQKNSKFKNLFD